MARSLSAYEIALQELEHVATIMNLSDEVVGFLSTPHRIMTVNIPVRMDDGTLKFFTGYRAQHNSALGPVKGGTRFHPEETLDDVKALSFWMTISSTPSPQDQRPWCARPSCNRSPPRRPTSPG